MTSATLKLEKIIHLCEKRNFFSVLRSENSLHHINYGPLGTRMQNNIVREWNRTVFSNAATTIFPVKCPTFQLSHMGQSLLPGMLQQYLPTLKMVGDKLPFGLAQIGTCRQERDGKLQSGILPSILKPEEFTSLRIVFFASPKSSGEWLNFWLKRRLTWWKQFSGLPSAFSATEISETEAGVQSAELLYQAPWGNLHLEKLSNLGSEPLEELAKETDQRYTARDGRKIILPHVIVCEKNLHTAMLTYLLDAYDEKEKGIVLQLHRRLAPYKAAIAIGSNPAQIALQLQDLAKHITADLMQLGISLLPNPDLYNSASLESQFSRFDELGLPYSIVLSEGTLRTGLVSLRNRSSTRKEPVHVSDVKATLLRNLEIREQLDV